MTGVITQRKHCAGRWGGSKNAVACSTGEQRTCLCEIVFFEAGRHAHVRHVGT